MAFDDLYYEDMVCDECKIKTLRESNGFVVCENCGLVHDRQYYADKSMLKHTAPLERATYGKPVGTYVGMPRRQDKDDKE